MLVNSITIQEQWERHPQSPPASVPCQEHSWDPAPMDLHPQEPQPGIPQSSALQSLSPQLNEGAGKRPAPTPTHTSGSQAGLGTAAVPDACACLGVEHRCWKLKPTHNSFSKPNSSMFKLPLQWLHSRFSLKDVFCYREGHYAVLAPLHAEQKEVKS